MSNMWFVKNGLRVGRDFSWRLDIYALASFMYMSPSMQFGWLYRLSEKKHRFIIDYLEKNQADVIARFKDYKEPLQQSEKKIIWTIWWQGEEQAPPLVKACLESVKRNLGNAEYRIITKDNYKEYLDLPDFIWEKHREGRISFALLSDIMRFRLLSLYGGIWLDSTIFVGGRIPDEIFTYPFWSQHTKYEKNAYVQKNLYHFFTIGGLKGNLLCTFAYEFLIEYWKKYDTIIDYFLSDYTIFVAYRNFQAFKDEIDSLPYTSERLYELVHSLDDPYDEERLNDLLAECTYSKLDWHRKYRTEVNGRETIFSHLTRDFT